jgi:hypothetical protein
MTSRLLVFEVDELCAGGAAARRGVLIPIRLILPNRAMSGTFGSVIEKAELAETLQIFRATHMKMTHEVGAGEFKLTISALK